MMTRAPTSVLTVAICSLLAFVTFAQRAVQQEAAPPPAENTNVASPPDGTADAGGGSASAVAEAAQQAAPPIEQQGGTVFVLPVHGPIDKSMLYIFRRAFREAERLNPKAIIVDVDTPGGRILETEEILAWLRSVEVPRYAFVSDKAQSAGAMICLGTGRIFMAPGSRVGSAMPVLISPTGGVQEMPDDMKEKILSDVRAMVRGLAQENGHSEDLGEAMVDPEKEVKIGETIVSAKGQLLNMTAMEAVRVIPPSTKPLFAEAIVDNIDDLLRQVGLGKCKIVTFEEESAERLARYITMVGPLLLMLGVLGIYIEIKTPGFGLPGIAGICCLTLFFFGHYIAGFAGIEEIFIVVLGFALLAIEVFVIPGFGVAGLAGIILIITGIVLSLLPYIPDTPTTVPDWPGSGAMDAYLQTALYKLMLTVGGCGVGIWLLAKFLPKTAVYRNLVLDASLAHGSGREEAAEDHRRQLTGREGVALTALRPAGTVVVGKERLDVVTTGDMVGKGATVRVVQVEGNRIVVEEL